MSDLLTKDVATYKKEQVDFLVRFFNSYANVGYRLGYAPNRNAIIKALDVANDNLSEIKSFIKNYVDTTQCKDLVVCFDAFVTSKGVEVPQDQEVDNKIVNSVIATQPAPPTSQDQVINYSMGLLEKAVIDLISKAQAEKIESQILGQVEQKVKDFIKDEYGTIERKVKVVVNDKKVEMQGITHEKFETILKFVMNNEPVFLTGPAGCGKNVVCKQVADALGIPFYFTNAVTQEYKITGFTDAMGQYQETQFYKAFKDGGVFMLDEMDASIPEVLIILNSAIANRYFDFPAPIGMVHAHPNFRVIAAGNTFGEGADFEYVGRNQLDGASLDRFALVKMDYSQNIELNVAQGNEELVSFCREYRKVAKQNGLKVIVSYRAIGRLAKMIDALGLEEALSTCLIKGLGKDDIKMLASQMTENKYTSAMKKIAKKMED